MEITLSRTVHEATMFQEQSSHKTICLIGNNFTGRTTFSMLVQRYVHNDKNYQLIFQENKYVLEGVLAAKNTKMQTLALQRYRMAEEIDLVDVPSYILPSENKKWPSLCSRAFTALFFQKLGQVCFILTIDERNLRNSEEELKKLLSSFLSIFKTPEPFLPSICLMVTKVPPECRRENIFKRLEVMLEKISKDKKLENSFVSKTIEILIQKQQVYLFYKVTNDAREAELIQTTHLAMLTIPFKQIFLEELDNLLIEEKEDKLALEYWYDSEQFLKEFCRKLEVFVNTQKIECLKLFHTLKQYYDASSDPSRELIDRFTSFEEIIQLGNKTGFFREKHTEQLQKFIEIIAFSRIFHLPASPEKSLDIWLSEIEPCFKPENQLFKTIRSIFLVSILPLQPKETYEELSLIRAELFRPPFSSELDPQHEPDMLRASTLLKCFTIENNKSYEQSLSILVQEYRTWGAEEFSEEILHCIIRILEQTESHTLGKKLFRMISSPYQCRLLYEEALQHNFTFEACSEYIKYLCLCRYFEKAALLCEEYSDKIPARKKQFTLLFEHIINEEDKSKHSKRENPLAQNKDIEERKNRIWEILDKVVPNDNID